MATGTDVSVGASLAWSAPWVLFGVVGALLVTRKVRHPIAWLMVAIGATGMGNPLRSWGVYDTITEPGSLVAGDAALWLANLLSAPGMGLLVFVVLLFPSGVLPSPRWRIPAAAGAVALVALTAWYAVTPGNIPGGAEGGPYPVENPWAIAGLEPIAEPGRQAPGFLLVGLGLATAVNVVVRFRRSTGPERLQLRWFGTAAAVFPICGVIGIAGTTLSERILLHDVADQFLQWGLPLSFGGLAVAIGIAVSRYRLYEIDRLISRTLAWLLLTGLLVGLYALGVLGVGALLPGERNDLLVAASTLAVAAAFRPLRTRIQNAVDRRFNRSVVDTARTIDSFAARLRDEVDVDAVATDLRQTVGEAFSPRTMTIWTKAAT
jgi:hypothetical protein